MASNNESNDRPEISISDLESETNKEEPSSTLREQIGAMADGKDPSNPVAVQRSLRTGFLVTLFLGSVCIYGFRNAGIWNIALCLG